MCKCLLKLCALFERLRKLQGGDVKGTFLAYAGLKRMSMEDTASMCSSAAVLHEPEAMESAARSMPPKSSSGMRCCLPLHKA